MSQVFGIRTFPEGQGELVLMNDCASNIRSRENVVTALVTKKDSENWISICDGLLTVEFADHRTVGFMLKATVGT